MHQQVIRQLQKGNICTINKYSYKYNANPMEVLAIFINTFKDDKNQNFELLCHIVVMKNQEMKVQMESYSNIQKGFIMERSNNQAYSFEKSDIKELKVLAIIPKKLPIPQAQSMLQVQPIMKTKDYVNKFVVLPKLITQNGQMLKQKSKKQEKGKEKAAQIKKQKSQPQLNKNLKRTQSKSSIETQKKTIMEAQQKKSIALKKVSSKDQSSKASTPVLTNYEVQRQKMEENMIVPKSNKLLLDSDEDVYDPRANNEMFKVHKEKNVETDLSAQKQEKMDIQGNMNKKVGNFIVNDQEEDQDEDEIFQKMDQFKKKDTQSQHRSQSLTKQKNQNTNNPSQKMKPQVAKPSASSKPQPQAIKQASAPLGNKNMLMNWLKPKK